MPRTASTPWKRISRSPAFSKIALSGPALSSSRSGGGSAVPKTASLSSGALIRGVGRVGRGLAQGEAAHRLVADHGAGAPVEGEVVRRGEVAVEGGAVGVDLVEHHLGRVGVVRRQHVEAKAAGLEAQRVGGIGLDQRPERSGRALDDVEADDEREALAVGGASRLAGSIGSPSGSRERGATARPVSAAR